MVEKPEIRTEPVCLLPGLKNQLATRKPHQAAHSVGETEIVRGYQDPFENFAHTGAQRPLGRKILSW